MQSSIHHGVVLKTFFMYSIHENHQLLEYRFNRTGLFIAYHYYIRDIPVCLLLTWTALSSFFSAWPTVQDVDWAISSLFSLFHSIVVCMSLNTMINWSRITVRISGLDWDRLCDDLQEYSEELNIGTRVAHYKLLNMEQREQRYTVHAFTFITIRRYLVQVFLTLEKQVYLADGPL